MFAAEGGGGFDGTIIIHGGGEFDLAEFLGNLFDGWTSVGCFCFCCTSMVGRRVLGQDVEYY